MIVLHPVIQETQIAGDAHRSFTISPLNYLQTASEGIVVPHPCSSNAMAMCSHCCPGVSSNGLKKKEKLISVESITSLMIQTTARYPPDTRETMGS